jgi:microcompartment protein CcmL/EutN
MSSLAHETLAAVELVSVPAGLCALDALVKEAEVEILFAGDIDPSRFLVLFCGDLSSVESALRRAIEEGGNDLLETLLLPHAHRGLRAALDGELLAPAQAEAGEEAMGILQTHTVIGTLAAVDKALKAAEVHLIRLRFATELAGQGHAVFVGSQYDVEAGLQAAQSDLPPGVQVLARRIARPASQVYSAAGQRPFGHRAVRPLDA